MTDLPRVAARWMARQARNDLLTLDKAIQMFGRPTRSVYGTGRDSAFRWATPAPNFSGGGWPVPWRVADKDAAQAVISHLTSDRDLVVDYWGELYQGRNQLWVGLRDNRDGQAHAQRMLNLSKAILKHGWKVRTSGRGARIDTIYLIDDVTKDAWQKAAR